MSKAGARSYIPDRGDLIWVSLQPTARHEQPGRRPALYQPLLGRT